MNPSVRIRHRFGRSGAFDLRRKVLLKNFLRKHQLITEALEEDMNLTENKEQENITESDVQEPNDSDVLNSSFVEEPEEESEAEVPTHVNISEADPKPEGDSPLQVDMEVEPTVSQDNKVEEKPTFRQKLKRKFSVKKQHSTSESLLKSEENLENTSTDEHDDLSDVPCDNHSSKKLKLDANGDLNFPLLEKCTTHSKNVEEKTNSSPKRKRRFSFRRPYSFSKQKESPLEPPENLLNGRLTRSMVRKRKNRCKQKKYTMKSCLKHLLSKECNTVTTEPVKNKKPSRFLIKMFQAKNPVVTMQHDTDFNVSSDAVSHESHAHNTKKTAQASNPSVSVQTLLTCLPDTDVPTGGTLCIDDKVFDKIINYSVPVGKDGYWLRSCPSPEKSSKRILHSSNFSVDRHPNWNQPVKNRNLQLSKNVDNISTRTRSFDSKELPRSKSVHEKALKRPHVCRRVKSVYVPNIDCKYSDMYHRL